MAWRAPMLLQEPRIWAEEGTVYMAYAYANPAWKALLAPHQGYFHLLANVATLLALQVPLRHAPLVTTWMAYAVQALPLAVVLWGTAPLWGTLPRKALVVLIIMLTPSSGECWLNSINSQFFLALTAALLLLEEPPRTSVRRWIYRGILALAVLSGPVTAFLAPLYVARGLARKREREAGTQAWLIVAGAMFQAGIILTTLDAAPAGAVRFGGLSFTNLLAVIVNRTVVVPVASMGGGRFMAEAMLSLQRSGAEVALGWALLVYLAILAIYLCWHQPTQQRYLLLASLLMTSLSTISALIAPDQTKWVLIHPGTAIRYYYAPSVLLMLALMGRIKLDRQRWWHPGSVLAGAALVTCLTLGAADYRSLMDPFVSADWPVWREQVAIWETRPGHRLLIWPPPWEMRLVRWD